MLIRRRDGSTRAQTAISSANNVDFRIGRSMVQIRVDVCSDSLAKSLITGRLLLAMNKETITPFRLSIFSSRRDISIPWEEPQISFLSSRRPPIHFFTRHSLKLVFFQQNHEDRRSYRRCPRYP
jgi:hypothetical protein